MQSQNNKLPSPSYITETRGYTTRIMRWSFGAVMTIVVLTIGLSFWRVELGQQAMDEIVSHEHVTVEKLYRMQLAARDRTFALFGAVHSTDPFERDHEIQRFYELGNTFAVVRQKLDQLHLTETEQAQLATQQAQTLLVMSLQNRVIELLESGRSAEAERLMIERVVPTQNQMIRTLTLLLEGALDRANEHALATRKAQHRATALFIAGGLACVILTWWVFVQVGRKMGSLVTRLANTSEQLHASNHELQFQQSALNSHNIVSVADRNGNITAVNDKFCEVSQYTREELLGKNHRLLKSGQHSDHFYDDLWATISAGKVWHGEICNRRKDGTLYWVASTILPCIDDDGLPGRYVSVRTEITPIKEAQLVLQRSRDDLEQLVQRRSGELAEREKVLRSITNAAQDAVMMIDHEGQVSYWNPAAEKMFGYAEAEVVGKNLHELIVPERYLERANQGFSRFVSSGDGPSIGKTTALQARHRNGKEFPVDISLSAMQLGGNWNAVGIVRDATDRVQTEERLRQLATTDTLTGICNRRHFDEVLDSEIERTSRFSNPLSLILFDIDHFKRINDSFGHQAGDRVLIQLSRAIEGMTRTTDLFARWGGEEFVVLLPGSDLDAGRVLAEKLRMMLEKQHFSDVGQVTCSFGVAEHVRGEGRDALIKRADHCLYHAKSAGRNRVETTETTSG